MQSLLLKCLAGVPEARELFVVRYRKIRLKLSLMLKSPKES